LKKKDRSDKLFLDDLLTTMSRIAEYIEGHNNPKIPWHEMYYFRNRVMHEYFGIDYEIIWDVAKNHLPENSRQIDKILKSLQ
jgi:uncharacterized protein with HEPN domain